MMRQRKGECQDLKVGRNHVGTEGYVHEHAGDCIPIRDIRGVLEVPNVPRQSMGGNSYGKEPGKSRSLVRAADSG